MSGGRMRPLVKTWAWCYPRRGDRRRVADISFVTKLSEAGRAFFVPWQRAGSYFALSFLAFLVTLPAAAANLKQETVAAWNEYVDGAQANLQRRVDPRGCFLWTMENPDRAARVNAGEILITPISGGSPRKVPGGLIHHWIGAMFIPNMSTEKVVEFTRDYDRYKDYYQPSVLESKTLGRDNTSSQFLMRMMNKNFFLKTVLDADYQATYTRLDRSRAYSISKTTRVQEIEEYGEEGQHKVPEGEGSGYIWKLFSIARFEQGDAGVYVELEAVALSREIPVAARLFVDPVVRRVSRNSMLISLEQTRAALSGSATVNAQRETISAGGGRGRAFLPK